MKQIIIICIALSFSVFSNQKIIKNIGVVEDLTIKVNGKDKTIKTVTVLLTEKDTLETLKKDFNTTEEVLIELNNQESIKKLKVGTVIKVPKTKR